MIQPLAFDFDGLRVALQAEKVTQAQLPPQITQDWITADGRARLSIAPKNTSGSNEALRHFASSVLAVEPAATEGPISILEAGNTVVHAFLEAGALALVSIAALLWLVLRKPGDVALTLIPLITAAVVTLEITVLIGMPLNFANIIALPLLLGVGVAFKIYYIMAWRQGQSDLLQTSLTRAVIFSAATTATAFGSLWFSNHPGTSSMGKLLALSLGLHIGRGRAVPADPDGKAARGGARSKRRAGRGLKPFCEGENDEIETSSGVCPADRRIDFELGGRHSGTGRRLSPRRAPVLPSRRAGIDGFGLSRMPAGSSRRTLGEMSPRPPEQRCLTDAKGRRRPAFPQP